MPPATPMTQEIINRLKECPHCGAEADDAPLDASHAGPYIHDEDVITCGGCGIMFIGTVEQWNTRPLTNLTPSGVERHRHALAMMLAEIPHYEGDDPRAFYYSRNREALEAALASLALPSEPPSQPFQQRVDAWLIACFGEEIARDKIERNHRFLEEANELAQAAGCTASEAHQLVDYVFSRPVGEIGQEVGGVMNTLAALCLAHGLDMAAEGDREMARVWTKVDAIREKQRTKPKHSPLPQPPSQGDVEGLIEQQILRSIQVGLSLRYSPENIARDATSFVMRALASKDGPS